MFVHNQSKLISAVEYHPKLIFQSNWLIIGPVQFYISFVTVQTPVEAQVLACGAPVIDCQLSDPHPPKPPHLAIVPGLFESDCCRA